MLKIKISKDGHSKRPLTIEMVLDYLGKPEKIVGNQLMWACSHCEVSENSYLKYDVFKGHFDCPKKTHWQAIKEEIIDRWEINKAHERFFVNGK